MHHFNIPDPQGVIDNPATMEDIFIFFGATGHARLVLRDLGMSDIVIPDLRASSLEDVIRAIGWEPANFR